MGTWVNTDAKDESDALAEMEAFGFRNKAENLRTLRPLIDWGCGTDRDRTATARLPHHGRQYDQGLFAVRAADDAALRLRSRESGSSSRPGKTCSAATPTSTRRVPISLLTSSSSVEGRRKRTQIRFCRCFSSRPLFDPRRAMKASRSSGATRNHVHDAGVGQVAPFAELVDRCRRDAKPLSHLTDAEKPILPSCVGFEVLKEGVTIGRRRRRRWG